MNFVIHVTILSIKKIETSDLDSVNLDLDCDQINCVIRYDLREKFILEIRIPIPRWNRYNFSQYFAKKLYLKKEKKILKF